MAVNTMMKNNKSLFQIHERLNAEIPDMLQHHRCIEREYIAFQIESTGLTDSDKGEGEVAP